MKSKALLFIFPILVSICLTSCAESNDTNTNISNEETDASSDTLVHEHTFNNGVWEYDEEYHWHPSSCGHDVRGSKSKHIFNKSETNPTFESDGLITYSCSICGYSYTEKGKDKLNHNYSTQWSYDEHSHWHACIDNGYEDLKADEEHHCFEDVVTNSTFENKGYTTHTCTECGYSYKDSETNKLNHNYSTDWSYDEHSHWHACIDNGYEDLKADEEHHCFEDTIVEPTYYDSGYTNHTCTKCGYSYIDTEVEKKYLTVTWLNYDGTELEKDTRVEYGSIPTYDGEIPAKPHDTSNEFDFIGWEPEVTNITSNQTYIAKFEAVDRRTFDIFFNLNGGTGNLFWDGDGTFHDYSSNHATKNRDEVFYLPMGVSRQGYIFKGWNNIYEQKTYQPNYAFKGNFDVTFWAMWELNDPCENCNATGYVKGDNCSDCGGTGTISTKCSGGFYQNGYHYEGMKCPNCGRTSGFTVINGIGDACNYCFNHYGKIYTARNVLCTKCGGDGILETHICQTCSGRGYLNKACPICNGTGGWFEDKSAPILAHSDYHTIELKIKEGYEYSLGGEFWQSSPLFEDLESGTPYVFYQRRATKGDIPFGITSEPLHTSTLVVARDEITYILDGGINNPSNPSTYSFEENIVFANPTREGYTFLGWYDADGNKVTSINKGTTGEIVLSAKWSANLNDLSVISDDELKGTVTVVSGNGYSDETIVVSATPVGDCVFNGWYDDNDNLVTNQNPYTFTMPLTDYYLEARFVTQAEEEWNILHGVTPTIDLDNMKVTYGLYPQTNVNNSSLVSALNALATPESNGWYLYNNEYYAKVDAAPYSSNYAFGNGTTIVSGTTYWFKCEPITWNIISNNNGEYCLLSSILLDVHRYNEYYTGTKNGYYANNYMNSEIRSWLNDDFYNSAFSLGNIYIQTTLVANSHGSENTNDKVFLPSYSNYEPYQSNSPYSNSRYCKTTDWARARGAYYYNDTESHRYEGIYWTRTPYWNDSDHVKIQCIVPSSTSNDTIGCNAKYVCARPSLSLKIS